MLGGENSKPLTGATRGSIGWMGDVHWIILVLVIGGRDSITPKRFGILCAVYVRAVQIEVYTHWLIILSTFDLSPESEFPREHVVILFLCILQKIMVRIVQLFVCEGLAPKTHPKLLKEHGISSVEKNIPSLRFDRKTAFQNAQFFAVKLQHLFRKSEAWFQPVLNIFVKHGIFPNFQGEHGK